MCERHRQDLNWRLLGHSKDELQTFLQQLDELLRAESVTEVCYEIVRIILQWLQARTSTALQEHWMRLSQAATRLGRS